jgi:hypothetical protein
MKGKNGLKRKRLKRKKCDEKLSNKAQPHVPIRYGIIIKKEKKERKNKKEKE